MLYEFCLLKALCHDLRVIFNKLVSHDITAPTRLKSRTEFSINGCSLRLRTRLQGNLVPSKKGGARVGAGRPAEGTRSLWDGRQGKASTRFTVCKLVLAYL